MSKFRFGEFEGGDVPEFVVHAKKYSKVEAMEIRFGKNGVIPPVAIDKKHVRYYVKVPYWVGIEKDGGCYSYCQEGERGSFPVWVINFSAKGETE